MVSKAIKFPFRFDFTTPEMDVKSAVVNSIEDYTKHASKRKVPVEDAVNGLARRVGMDTSRIHISKVKPA